VAVEATLGLGGNLGDPVLAFAAALRRLGETPGLRLVRRSSVYRTPPWGVTEQPEFLNMAVLVESELSAAALLLRCLSIEAEQGRERRERWGPRTLDIDLLTYGEDEIDEPGLHVPHPRIAERAFVLVPLAEIMPDLRIGSRAVQSLADNCDHGGIRRDKPATTRLEELLS